MCFKQTACFSPEAIRRRKGGYLVWHISLLLRRQFYEQHKKAKPKRLLSLFLVLVMVLGMLSAMSITASASTGSGTEGDPYIVTDYEELRECMQSTPDYDTRYIKLGEDITNSTNVSKNALDLTSPYQTVILDLNGYTLKRAESATDWGVFMLSIGNLTIQDSSSAGTGKVVSEITGATYKNAIYVSSSGNLSIEGGTFESTESAIRTQGGTTVINGGTYRTSYVSAFFQSGTVTVNGGSFSGTNGSAIAVNSDADVTINGCTASGKIGVNGGGSIWNFIPTTSTVTVNGAAVNRTGDTLSGEIIITKNVTTGTGSGTKDDPYVVTTYAELKNLMATAPKDGSTRYIKLGADLISNGNSNDNDLALVNASARVDLDLAGHSITRDEYTADWSVFYIPRGYLTVRDSVGTGRVVENIRGASRRNVFNVTGDAHLTIESGTFESKTYNVIFGQGGTTVINGGTFTNETTAEDGLKVIMYTGGNLTINGGDFRGRKFGIQFNEGVTAKINACTVSLTTTYGFLISVNGGDLTNSRFGEYSKILKADGTEFRYYNIDVDGVKYYNLEGAYCRVIGPIPVKKVAIEGIVPPVAGEAPSNIVGGDTVLEHCSIDKYIGGEHVGENTVEWVDCNTMNPVETFEAGKLYMVTIRLVADEGFSFSTKAAEYETLTVNGDDDAFVWKVQNDGKYAYIGYIFEAAAAGAAVKTVDISVDDHFTDYMTAGPDVTVSGSNFSSELSGLWHTWNDKDLSDTNKSVAGMSYYKTITLTATGDYKFNVATAVNVTGGGKLNYNNISEDGKTMTVSVKATATEHEHDYGWAMKYNSSNHWYECSLCGEKKDFGSHSLKYYSTGAGPAPGTTADFTCYCGYSEPHTMPGTSVSEFYAVAVRPRVNMALIEDSVYLKSWWAEMAEIVPGSIKWYKNDETTPLPVGYIFRSGEDYKVTVQFKAKDGYSFNKSMTGDGSGAYYEKGIDILNSYNYNTVVQPTIGT